MDFYNKSYLARFQKFSAKNYAKEIVTIYNVSALVRNPLTLGRQENILYIYSIL